MEAEPAAEAPPAESAPAAEAEAQPAAEAPPAEAPAAEAPPEADPEADAAADADKAAADAEKERLKAEAAAEKEQRKAEDKAAKKLAAEEKKAKTAGDKAAKKAKKAKGSEPLPEQAPPQAARAQAAPEPELEPEPEPDPEPAPEPAPAPASAQQQQVVAQQVQEVQVLEVEEEDEIMDPADPRIVRANCRTCPLVRGRLQEQGRAAGDNVVCQDCTEYRRAWAEKCYAADTKPWWRLALDRNQAAVIGQQAPASSLLLPAASAPAEPASKWRKETTATGRAYYWHRETRETVWDHPPADFSAAMPERQRQRQQHQHQPQSQPQPQPQPEPEPEPEQQPEPEPEPELEPKAQPQPRPRAEPRSLLTARTKVSDEPASNAEVEMETDELAHARGSPLQQQEQQPSMWRQRRRRRQREAEILQVEAARDGSWWTPAGIVQVRRGTPHVDTAVLPPAGSGVAARRRRRAHRLQPPAETSTKSMHASMLSAAPEASAPTTLFYTDRTDERSGLLCLLQMASAVRTAARLGCASSYIDLEDGWNVFETELNACKNEATELSKTMAESTVINRIACIRQFARYSARDLLAVRSRLTRSNEASTEVDTRRSAANFCQEWADWLINFSGQDLIDLLSFGQQPTTHDYDVQEGSSANIQHATTAGPPAPPPRTDSVWRAQTLQLAERIAELEAHPNSEASTAKRLAIIEREHDSQLNALRLELRRAQDKLMQSHSDDSDDSGDLQSDSGDGDGDIDGTSYVAEPILVLQEKDANMNVNVILNEAVDKQQQQQQHSDTDTVAVAASTVAAVEQQLKLERELRKAAEHALQEAIKMNGQANNAHVNTEKELQRSRTKIHEMQMEWADLGAALAAEKAARHQVDERIDELTFLLSCANSEITALKQERSEYESQMQVLKFEEKAGGSAKSRAEAALQVVEKDQRETQQQYLSLLASSEELRSALEMSQQESRTLEAKLEISAMQVTELGERLRTTKIEMQQRLVSQNTEHAQSMGALEDANREAMAETEEAQELISTQQELINDLSAAATHAAAVSRVGEHGVLASVGGEAAAPMEASRHREQLAMMTRERQELVAANAALLAELERCS